MPVRHKPSTVPERDALPLSFTPPDLDLYLLHISPEGWEAAVTELPDHLGLALVPPVRERKPPNGKKAGADPDEPTGGGLPVRLAAVARRAAITREGSDRRAKRVARKVARKNRLRVLVTLTFPGEGIHDRKLARKLASDWMHKHGRDILGQRYMSFDELHPKGHGWHIHLLTQERLPSWVLKAFWDSWTAFLGRRGIHPSGGAKYVRIDVEELPTKQAANYAAKYVTKDWGEGHQLAKGAKRYVSSHGLERSRSNRVPLTSLRRWISHGYITGRSFEELLLVSAYDGRQDGRPFIHLGFDFP